MDHEPAAFLLGAGMYSSFIILPQFAQLPTSTGFGFGASVVTSALYLLPAALCMGLLGTVAGRVARRFGSKAALVAGTSITRWRSRSCWSRTAIRTNC